MVALHSGGATCAQLIPFCSSLDDVAEIFAPEGPVPSEGRFGTLGAGRDWFVEDDLGAIEPQGFADSLQQVEQFVFDTLDEVRGPDGGQPGLWLLGLGQGAVMALTICTYWPELFAGVVSIDGRIPEIGGWEPPLADLKGLPVLLVSDPDATRALGGRISRSASKLTTLGANVTTEDCPAARLLTPRLSASILRWMRGVEASQSSSATPP